MKNQIAKNILETSIAEWPQVIRASRADLQDVEQHLAALIQRATLLHAYIGHAHTSGCGEQPHEASAKHANKALAKVRAAMGYSYPKNLPVSVQY